MPSRHCRCVSNSVATLIDNPNLVHAHLVRRRNRGQAVDIDTHARRRVDVDDLRLTVLRRQARLVIVLCVCTCVIIIPWMGCWIERMCYTYVVPAV